MIPISISCSTELYALGLEHRDCTSHPVVQAWFGNPEMVNLLLQAGADPELRNCLGRSYLEALTLGGSGC